MAGTADTKIRRSWCHLWGLDSLVYSVMTAKVTRCAQEPCEPKRII